MLSDLNHNESGYVAPGLLPIFRVLIGLQLLVTVIVLIIAANLLPELDLREITFWIVGSTVALLFYLTWHPLQRKLGRWYLPLALLIATLLPMIPRMRRLLGEFHQDAWFLTDEQIVSSGWRLLLTLLVPLVFVAWQYRFRWVLVYSLSVTMLNLITAIFGFERGSTLWSELIDQSLSGGITFLIIGYVITQLVRAQQEKQQALADANAQLVNYASTMEQLAVSRERNRLARDLHDTVAHTLSALTVQLEAVDSALDYSPEQARSILGKTLANARGGLAETRRALRALRASPLDDLGLVLAIRTLAESTAARSGLSLALHTPNELSLAPELEQNMYRIAQEAIENVIRHANATALSVILALRDGATLLEIQDDGRGFVTDNKQDNNHFGLRGMAERAQLIGATLTVNSQPGEGTTVQVLLPRE